MMIKMEKNGYDTIYRLYQSNDMFFPLIAAVLLDEQDGVVYVDDPASPSQAYVEHAFGFAQVFGKIVEPFEQELERYLLVNKLFKPGKVRLYAPYLPGFLALPEHESMRSYRQRFTISAENFPSEQGFGIEPQSAVNLGAVDEKNITLIDNRFDIVRRFWRNPADFIQKSRAVVVFYKGAPASICYSAAEADQRAEIDVLTLPAYRTRGFAKFAVMHFVNQCFRSSVRPLWDCFTNNAGSMMLSKSAGFVATKAPYPFYTINR